ncbi:5'-nucleotidase [Coralloluteibacterium stylophorae]|uniref:5'-nucleotidase n=1 Tax=Coralloluteibacterium stylophorae TaxID=1776034 RepID=A0A8J7VTP2_9GAMM|nr:5'-nucleotidase [Coralloluteibacterium stylophorae]MBS7456332.1 5'-nucleotidase [Coralloluteibacterium stylophorae]
MPPAEPDPDRLVVAITARALFDLEESHRLFEAEGLDAYSDYQRTHENEPLSPGIAFPLVKKLIGLNANDDPEAPRVEVILLSRNSSDTGLRIFNSIEHYGLRIIRAVFTGGAPTTPYIRPFGAQLFLSANPESVRHALDHGVAAATILPARATSMEPAHPQLRIAFDGDAVIFSDESERISQERGVAAFHANERELANTPLSGGPFRAFLAALHSLQQAFPPEDSPIRTALVTARSAPAHKRVILTLREWGVRLDEALFLGGRDKGPFLRAFGADLFFDDSQRNIDNASLHVAAGHVPHGVSNPRPAAADLARAAFVPPDPDGP